jgi:hypothetical protein
MYYFYKSNQEFPRLVESRATEQNEQSIQDEESRHRHERQMNEVMTSDLEHRVEVRWSWSRTRFSRYLRVAVGAGISMLKNEGTICIYENKDEFRSIES